MKFDDFLVYNRCAVEYGIWGNYINQNESK